MQTSFPRGGSVEVPSSSAESGSKRRRDHSEKDVLFGSKRLKRMEVAPTKNKDKKSSSKKSTKEADAVLPSIGLGLMSQTGLSKLTKVERLHVKKFTTGSLALGFVLQIHKNHIIVSLPGGFTGVVQLEEFSDHLHNLLADRKSTTDKVPSLVDMVSQWQPVRCYVLGQSESEKETKRSSLKLSMRLSLINRGLALKHLTEGFVISACVYSVEDHGYIMSVGISSITCFLPKKAVPSNFGSLQVGQLVDCIVSDVDEGARTVKLRAHKKSISEAVIHGNTLPVNGVHPGMQFTVVIDSVLQNGLVVKFLGSFYAVIDNFSLSRHMTQKELMSEYSIGDVLIARVVFADHATKTIRMSLRPHVLALRAPSSLPALGDIMMNLQVAQSLKYEGLLLIPSTAEESLEEDVKDMKESGRLSSKDKKMQLEKNEMILGIQIPTKNLNDPSTNEAVKKGSIKIAKTYPVGSSIDRVRVLGYHLVEGIAIGSNISNIISEDKAIHSSNIIVGEKYTAKVKEVTEHGIHLQIGNRIDGFCPVLHTSDVGLGSSSLHQRKLNKLYKTGQELSVRAWDTSSHSIIVTCKKSLLQEDMPSFLKSKEEAIVGGIFYGVVSKVSMEDGIRVHFCNGLKGYLPPNILIKQGIYDLTNAYKIGQTVQCVILQRTDSEKPTKSPKLILALNIGDTKEFLDMYQISKETKEATKEATNALQTGSNQEKPVSECELVSGFVVRVDEKEFSVRLDDGRNAILERIHCYDFMSTCDKIASSMFIVGKRVDRALVLYTKSNVVHITLKPLLLSVAERSMNQSLDVVPTKKVSELLGQTQENELITIPKSATDLSPGQVVAGWIHKVEDFGVLVKFRGKLTALVPRPNLADKFVSSPLGLFMVGDSIRCVIQRVDSAQERVILTCKPSLVSASSGNLNYCQSFLRERYQVSVEVSKLNISTQPNWKKYPIGGIVQAKVSTIKDYGVILIADDEVSIMLASKPHHAIDVAVGSSVSVRVLDIDFENNVFQVSMISDLVTQTVIEVPLLDDDNTKSKKSKKNNKDKANKSTSESTEISTEVPTRPSFTIGQRITGRIELVQEKYLVLSAKNSIVYVLVSDYHSSYLTTSSYEVHKNLSIRIESVPTDSKQDNPHSSVTVGSVQRDGQETRLVQTMKVQQEAEASDSQLLADTGTKDKKSIIDYTKLPLGIILPWEVLSITPMEIKLKPLLRNQSLNSFEDVIAILHVSCAIDQVSGIDNLNTDVNQESHSKDSMHPLHPFYNIRVGSRIFCRTMKVAVQHAGGTNQSKPSQEKASNQETEHDEQVTDGEGKDTLLIHVGLVQERKRKTDQQEDNETDQSKMKRHRQPLRSLVQWQSGIQASNLYAGVVTDISKLYCIVSLSPYVSARLYYTDVSKDMDINEKFMKSCFVGQRLVLIVTEVSLSMHRNHIAVSRAIVEDIVTNPGAKRDLRKSAEVDITSRLTKLSNKTNPGQIVYGLIDLQSHRVSQPPAVMVHVAGGMVGRICVTELNEIDDRQTSFTDLGSSTLTSIVIKSSKKSSQKSSKSSDIVIHHGQAVKCVVLGVRNAQQKNEEDIQSKVLDLSIRPSRLAMGKEFRKLSKLEKSTKKEKAEVKSLPEDPLPVEGSIVKGYVTNISSKGCFVRLSRNITGQVLMRDLSDTFVVDPSAKYPIGSLVTCCVLSVNADDHRCQLSMKQSVLVGDKKLRESIARLSVGSTVVGTVEKVTEFGVFVLIEGTSIVGLSRRNDALSATASAAVGRDLRKAYSPGDIVKAKVLEVNTNTKKVSLGLKPSYFTGGNDQIVEPAIVEEENLIEEDESESEEDMNMQEDNDEDEDDDDSSEESIEEISGDVAYIQEEDEDEDDESIEEMSEDNSDEEDKVKSTQEKKRVQSIQESSQPSKKHKHNPIMAVSDAIEWDDFAPAPLQNSNNTKSSTAEDDDEEDDDGSVSGNKSGGRRTRQKDAKKKKEEDLIRQREEALTSDAFIPESKNDYERLLLAQPNSSFLWIKYMTFYLQTADYAQARAVAERALRTINFREEDEKYNVWMAWINMEYKFGTNDTAEGVFKRAVNESKGKYIHLNLAQVFEKESNHEACEDIFNKALKKYKYSKKVWMAYQHYKLRQGKDAEAKELLNRSMQSLEKHKHVEVIMKFALAEYENGAIERGRYLFEELINTYTKRSDLWHVYVDREIKSNQFSYARQLFERMIGSKASLKNIKSIFKKYLEFERIHGTSESQELVKQKAKSFVQNLM